MKRKINLYDKKILKILLFLLTTHFILSLIIILFNYKLFQELFILEKNFNINFLIIGANFLLILASLLFFLLAPLFSFQNSKTGITFFYLAYFILVIVFAYTSIFQIKFLKNVWALISAIEILFCSFSLNVYQIIFWSFRRQLTFSTPDSVIYEKKYNEKQIKKQMNKIK